MARRIDHYFNPTQDQLNSGRLRLQEEMSNVQGQRVVHEREILTFVKIDVLHIISRRCINNKVDRWSVSEMHALATIPGENCVTWKDGLWFENKFWIVWCLWYYLHETTICEIFPRILMSANWLHSSKMGVKNPLHSLLAKLKCYVYS